MALAERSNKHGESWASQATIGADTGYSDRAVRKAMKALEEAGLITRKKRGTNRNGGGRTTDLITLAMNGMKPAATPEVTGTIVPVSKPVVTGTKYTGNSEGYLPEQPFRGTYIIYSRGSDKVQARKAISGRHVECKVIPFPKLGDAA